MHTYKAKINRIVDGDTVDFEVDLGFHVCINIRTTLLDIDTPERGHDEWAKATAMLTSLLNEQKDEDGYVVIKTKKTRKYGRWLVFIEGVNESLAKVWPYE